MASEKVSPRCGAGTKTRHLRLTSVTSKGPHFRAIASPKSKGNEATHKLVISPVRARAMAGEGRRGLAPIKQDVSIDWFAPYITSRQFL
jgi:hypothetical protein